MKNKKLAVLLSGNGTTLENLLMAIQRKELDALVAIVISSRENAYGLVRAKKWNIPTKIIPYRLYKNNNLAYSREITKALNEYKVDIVAFAGFLSLYTIADEYKNKVINIHPSLIPSFCGKGYYGLYVHKAVLNYGVKITGCTVHFVDNNYDKGPIIAQESVVISPDDTPESLQAKVMKKENILYPKVIQSIIENRLVIENRQVWIKENKEPK